MTETKRPLKVFLCHAHADRDAVRGLYAHLTKDGVDAWLDKEKLLPGQDWELEIRKAVREADVVIVCLSKQFNQAGFRQKEVRLALDTAIEKPEGEIFIIPARLEECDTLENLRKWHWVDLFEEDGYERLLRALGARSHTIGVTLQSKKSRLPKTDAPSSKKDVSDVAKKKVSSEQKRIVRPSRIKLPSWLRLPLKVFLALLIAWLALTNLDKWMLPIFQGLSSFKPSTSFDVPTSETPTALFSTLAITNTPLFVLTTSTEVTDSAGVVMRLIPAGEFTMGSDRGEPDEEPVRQVYLDAYYIDKYEVTNRLYNVCVDVGKCEPPNDDKRFHDQRYLDWPVVYVNWYQSNTYCEWRGANLPSEAQWEKAARQSYYGVSYTYPWGEGIECSKANYYGCIGDTTKVGSYEKGRSYYGLYDMAGNVAEWVSDWKSETYYLDSPLSNPLGPTIGIEKVLRGGAFSNRSYYLRTTSRFAWNPLGSGVEIGFRCAKDAP